MLPALFAFAVLYGAQTLIKLVRYLSWKNASRCVGTVVEQQEDGNYTEHCYTVSVDLDGEALQCTYKRKKRDKHDTGASFLAQKEPMDFLVKKEQEIAILPMEFQRNKLELRRDALISVGLFALAILLLFLLPLLLNR